MLSEIKIGEFFCLKNFLKIFHYFRNNSVFPCRYVDRGKYFSP